MKTVTTVEEMHDISRGWRREGFTVGLVPTMGYLHDGHLSLVDIASQKSDRTVVSIFVNPTQFGPGEDFETYPRDPERDQARCRQAGVDVIFEPSAREMYSEDSSTWVIEEDLSRMLCGVSRPSHFRGVTTVVAKLFNAVGPDIAVFGRKDAQQALIIKRMVRDLSFPIEVALGPIVREDDGLAMSSRNKYLSESERARAVSLSRGLRKAETRYLEGERSSEKLCEIVRGEILEAEGEIEYVELRECDQLRKIERVEQPALLAVAVRFETTRLIDNFFLE